MLIKRILTTAVTVILIFAASAIADSYMKGQLRDVTAQSIMEKTARTANEKMDALSDYDAAQSAAITDKIIEDTIASEGAWESFIKVITDKGTRCEDTFTAAFMYEQAGIQQGSVLTFIVSVLQLLFVVLMQALSLVWRFVKSCWMALFG